MELPPYIVRQLGNPAGMLGRFILWRLNSANRSMNTSTFKSLGIVADDRILEIGFGSGALLNRILSSGPALTAGVEISDLSIQNVMRRHRDAVKNGSLKLAKIHDASIPFPADAFSKACCVNVVYFWEDPASILAEVHRVLEAGGKLVICYEETGPNKREFQPDLIESYLKSAGFIDSATIEEMDSRNGTYFCTTAVKPAAS